MAGAVFVIEGNHQKLNLSASIESLPRHLKPNWWVSLTSHSSDELQPGPRMVSNGKLFTVSRVHDDVQNAFMVATMPRTSLGFVNLNPYKKKDREWETRLTAHRPFANLHASGNFYTSLGVAVPSRIPGIHAKDKPLGGVRFTVKGIFEIEGLRVTTGDRSFYSLSKPSDATCPAIKRYLDSLIPHCGF